MATNHTQNFNLNQWLATDAVLRSDFNADNQKIDAALKNMPRFVSGSYTGNGLTGEENPRKLTFTFTPILVVITADNTEGVVPGAVFIRGQALSNGMGTEIAYATSLQLHLSWTDSSVSWYSAATENYIPEKQLNKDGQINRYFALGF